jgi:hypothetical protein
MASISNLFILILSDFLKNTLKSIKITGYSLVIIQPNKIGIWAYQGRGREIEKGRHTFL